VPFASGRAAFLTEETHQVFHEKYTIEMRNRMAPLVEFFCRSKDKATAKEAVNTLNSAWGVSHILIDLSPKGATLSYFSPFSLDLSECGSRGVHRGKVLINFLKERIIYQDRDFAILSAAR
jgi:hypothetical protein